MRVVCELFNINREIKLMASFKKAFEKIIGFEGVDNLNFEPDKSEFFFYVQAVLKMKV